MELLKINKSRVFRQFFCLIMLFSQLPTIGQNSQDFEWFLEKYWTYRNRFLEKYIYVPSDLSAQWAGSQGVCMPAEYRSSDEAEPGTSMSWGDATGHLGYYIAVLATEYKLLKDHGFDNQAYETEKEISNALITLERLDYTAEGFFDGVNTTNGFFIRDDVDEISYLVEHFDSSDFDSDYIKKITVPTTDNNNMSQDQVISIMLGFSLVKSLCSSSNNTFPGYTAGGPSLRLVDRINTLVDLYYNGAFRTHYNDIVGDIWKIRNPVTDDCIEKRGMCYSDVKPWSLAHKLIGEEVSTHTIDFGIPIYAWQENLVSFPLLVEAVCISFALAPLSVVTYTKCIDTSEKTYVDHQRMVCSMIAKEWHCNTFANTMKNVENAGNRYNSTEYAFEHIPLIRQINHNGNPIDFSHAAHYDYYDLLDYIEGLLILAPENGNHSDQTEFDFTRHWASINRLSKPHRTILGEISPGYHNGLDYMLLHNLYWLSYEQNTPDNLSIATNYPIPHTFEDGETVILGSTNRRLKLCAKNQIQASNTIYYGGEVFYRASNVILNPGFEVEPGGTFYAGPHPMKQIDYYYDITPGLR